MTPVKATRVRVGLYKKEVHPMNTARRWNIVVTLLYDLCSGITIYDFKWEG